MCSPDTPGMWVIPAQVYKSIVLDLFCHAGILYDIRQVTRIPFQHGKLLMLKKKKKTGLDFF